MKFFINLFIYIYYSGKINCCGFSPFLLGRVFSAFPIQRECCEASVLRKKYACMETNGNVALYHKVCRSILPIDEQSK